MESDDGPLIDPEAEFRIVVVDHLEAIRKDLDTFNTRLDVVEAAAKQFYADLRKKLESSPLLRAFGIKGD